MPSRIASAFATGSAPGWARHTGQVCVFGGSPNDCSHPQNIFVRVSSCTWISIPMTASDYRDISYAPPHTALDG